MKRTITLMLAACCLLLTACDNSSIGIIGGSDGPTQVYINKSNENKDYEQYLTEHYVDESKLPILDINLEKRFISDDRVLITDDSVENEWELMIYEFYHNMTSGSFGKMKAVIEDESLLAAVENEEKNFKDGIYYSKICIDDLELLEKDDLKDISEKNKREIYERLNHLGISEFGIAKVETELKHNEKSLSLAPQVGDGEVTRYYLIGKKADTYKIFEVYWEEFLNDWLARTAEIILNYKPSLLYFDWWVQHQAFKPYLKKLAAFYYNCGVKWGKDVKICYKHDAMMFGSGIVEVERGGFAEAKPYDWQTDTAVARNSWCYTDTLDYKSSNEIICTLVDVVSKNGNLLLNIGPKADGTIPDGDRAILEDLAKWMKVNSEAVIGANVWRKSMEGPTAAAEGQFQDQKELKFTNKDYRFTINHGNIYAIALQCPKDGVFCIRSLADSSDQNVPEFHGIIESVDILGYDGRLQWSVDGEGLHVTAPGIDSEFPVVVRVRPE